MISPVCLNAARSIDVLDRLSVLCFAGTYGLALLAELARFFIHSSIRWYVAVSLMTLGWLVQTAFLANLALKNPLVLVTTPFESVMVLSWIVALIGLYLDTAPTEAGGCRHICTATSAGSCNRWLVCTPAVRLARMGRYDRVLGDRARNLFAWGCCFYLRSVLRRTHVFSTDAAPEGQTASAVRLSTSQP